MERIRCNVLQQLVSCHAGIVDDYVDGQFPRLRVGEVVLHYRDEVCRAIGIAKICLYGQGLDMVFSLEGGTKGFCPFSRRVRCVIEDNVGALKRLGNQQLPMREQKSQGPLALEARLVAMAAPIPLEPPVTIASLPSRERACARLERFVEEAR